MPLSAINTGKTTKITSYKLHFTFRGHSQKFDGRSRNFRGGREYGFRQEDFGQEYRRTFDRSTGGLLTGVQEDFGQEYRRTLDRRTGGDHAIAIGCVNFG